MVSTSNTFKSLLNKKNLAIASEKEPQDILDVIKELNSHIIDDVKTKDKAWLEGYRKAHQLDTLGEALTHLIGVYRAWHIEIFELQKNNKKTQWNKIWVK